MDNQSRALVSVIIRTCGRPAVLKNALESIRSQTYSNIEVIVVEDGKEESKAMLENEYPDLNIFYFSTGSKCGRSHVGNIGLKKATGVYLNFLDDDDIFYPKHIEILVEEIERADAGAVYSIAEESQIKVLSQKPYKYKEKRVLQRYKQPYNKLLLFAVNYIPIQSILFKRELYDELGGFDEQLEYLEDWDVWVRYSTISNFIFVPVATSKYFVPYRSKKKMERNRELESASAVLKEKFKGYRITANVADINAEMEYVLYVHNKKGIYHYLKMIRDFILYRDM